MSPLASSKKRFIIISLIALANILFFVYQSKANNYSGTGVVERSWQPTRNRFNFIDRYPSILDCSLDNYPRWVDDGSSVLNNDVKNEEHSKPASDDKQSMRVVRGVLFYFPLESLKHFEPEFRWLYRSWIEMQKHEPPKWRTDLIVFLDQKKMNKSIVLFDQLGCSFKNRRNGSEDKPKCVLLDYQPIRERAIKADTKVYKRLTKNSSQQLYEHILTNIDFMSSPVNQKDLNIVYHFLQDRLSKYRYLDSILMAFDGHEYLKAAGYHYLIRSDMDIFLTPLFAKWLPMNCNDFYVGKGAYSTTFNMKRLARIAKDLGLENAGVKNVGSTWYSTPDQFKLVAYLTLFGMGYISEEEFTYNEIIRKIGLLNWPYWHYGVLLLYGQNLMMNHLIATRQLNILKVDQLIDIPSTNNRSVDTIVHIHVYQNSKLFSKFQFKKGKYDHMRNLTSAAQVDANMPNSMYALKMALDGKFTSLEKLRAMAEEQFELKN